MKKSVYISGSTQENNLGTQEYGNEQFRMQEFSDMVRNILLELSSEIEVHRNHKGMSLEDTVIDCNKKGCDLFIDNHTNAGEAHIGGCEAFYYKGISNSPSTSFKFTELLYNKINSLGVNKGRGIKPDTSLYCSGLYVIQHTICPASLIELFFHTKKNDVDNYLKLIDEYAQAEADCILEFFDLLATSKTPVLKKIETFETLLKELVKAWDDLKIGR